MYRVENVSFEKILKEHNLTSLGNATNDALVRICYSIGISPMWVIAKETGQATGVLKRLETVDAIRRAKTFDIYMDESYWDEEQRQIANDNMVREAIATHEYGRQTFDLYEQLGWGFSNLTPGRSMELNVPERWIEDVLMKFPAVRVGDIKVTKIKDYGSSDDSGEVLEQRVEDASHDTDDTLADVSLSDLRRMYEAKFQKVPSSLMKRETLIARLKE